MNAAQARALVAAGRILQSKGWQGGRMKIEKREGETYPQAVARVVEQIDPHDRAKLREIVAWVLDYERGERKENAAAAPLSRRTGSVNLKSMETTNASNARH